MLDFELAEIYGYETKAFNQQVKRNIEKFDEDFMFQLTDEEVFELSRSQNVTLNKSAGRGSNIKYNPHVFTEQGIYMLMTVLKGEFAVKQSKALIRTFKQMKDYIVENQSLIGKREFLQLSMQITGNVVEMQDLRRDLRGIILYLYQNIGEKIYIISYEQILGRIFSELCKRKINYSMF